MFVLKLSGIQWLFYRGTKLHSSYGKCPCFLPFRGRSNITIYENIIGGPNNGLFSIAPCKVITVNLFCFIFGTISLLLFFISLSIVIAWFQWSQKLTAIKFLYFFISSLRARKSDNYCYGNSWKSNNCMESHT